MFENDWRGHWHWGLVGAAIIEVLLTGGLFVCYRSCAAEVCQGCLYIPFAPSIVLFSPILKSVSGFFGVMTAVFALVLNVLIFSAVLTPCVAGWRALLSRLRRGLAARPSTSKAPVVKQNPGSQSPPVAVKSPNPELPPQTDAHVRKPDDHGVLDGHAEQAVEHRVPEAKLDDARD